jgi:hypothetical protein
MLVLLLLCLLPLLLSSSVVVDTAINGGRRITPGSLRSLRFISSRLSCRRLRSIVTHIGAQKSRSLSLDIPNDGFEGQMRLPANTLDEFLLWAIAVEEMSFASREKGCLPHNRIFVTFPVGVGVAIITEPVDNRPNKAFRSVAGLDKHARSLLDHSPSDKVKWVHAKSTLIVYALKVGYLACKLIHGFHLAHSLEGETPLSDDLVGVVFATLSEDFSNLLKLTRVVGIVLQVLRQCLVFGIESTKSLCLLLQHGFRGLSRQEGVQRIPRALLVLVGLIDSLDRSSSK